MPLRAVIGLPAWGESPLAQYAFDLASGLGRRGFDARILVTQPEPANSPHGYCLEDSVRVESLPRAPHDRLSDVWLSLIRYLEECAPCVYVSNQDWIASLIAPRLSNRVHVIGVLHEDRPEEYDHCARLGSYWNAIVVRDPALRQRIIGEYPEHAARLAPVAGSSNGNGTGEADSFAALIERVAIDAATGRYRRRRRKMEKPPLGVVPDMQIHEGLWEVRKVNAVPLWPDRPQVQKPTTRTKSTSASLRDHRIVIAVPTGRISGVDIFSINLARALIARGYQAELVQTAPDANVSDRLALPGDVPVFQLELKPFPTWQDRWRAMRQHLEKRAPCIYIPNYDQRHSCIGPTLSPGVKIVGIGHSDDAQHFAHILHLAPYWDAVIGVSKSITSSIAALAPGIEARQYTIPYGVPVPLQFPLRASDVGKTLRIMYAGRIVRFQKRALDLVSILDQLGARGTDVELTVAGSGSELSEFLAAAGSALVNRRMRYVGGLANDNVVDLMRESDVFVLPSSFEGLPVSVLEAMANGCVPVATSIRSGIPEVIRDGDNGFIAPIGGIDEFVDHISLLASDRERLNAMRTRAYETVRDGFGLDRMTAAYVDVFEQVVSEPYVRPKGPVLPPPGLQGIQAMMPRFPMPMRRMVWRILGKGT